MDITASKASEQKLRAKLLARVEEAAPVLRGNALEAERLRTLPKSSVDALHQIGVYKLKLPREVGGYEAPMVTTMDVLEALAYHEASAGWCSFVGCASIGIMGAHLPDEGLEEVFANGGIPAAAGVLAPTGRAAPAEGGVRLNGRWSYASGIRHADYVMATCVFEREEGDVLGAAVLPVSEVEVHDDWYVVALQGTGSNSFSAHDLLVPERRIIYPMGKSQRGGPLFQMPFVASISNEHSAFALGLARRALDEVRDLAERKRRGPEGTRLADREAFLLDLGRADTAIRLARAGMATDVESLVREVESGAELRPDRLLEIQSAFVWVTELCADVVTTAWRYAGAGALGESDPLQQCLRNVHAATQHFQVSTRAYEGWGRTLLERSAEQSGPS